MTDRDILQAVDASYGPIREVWQQISDELAALTDDDPSRSGLIRYEEDIYRIVCDLGYLSTLLQGRQK